MEDNKLRQYIRDVIQSEMLIIKDEESDYQKFFNQALKKFGVSSQDQLSDVKKKEFFDYIDQNYKAKTETSSVSGMEGGDGFNTPGAFAKPGEDPKKKRALKNNKWDVVGEDFFIKGKVKLGEGKKEIPQEVKDLYKGYKRAKGNVEKRLYKDRLISLIKYYKLSVDDVFESVDFRNDENSPSKRLHQAVSTIRRSLSEIHNLVNKSSKFKQESGLTTDKYWVRTKSSLRKINEDLITIMNKLNNIK